MSKHVSISPNEAADRELQNVIERSLIIVDSNEFWVDKNWFFQEPRLSAHSQSADDDGAKKRVQTLLENCDYSVVDLGNLRDGGLIQQPGGPLAGRDFFERGE